ncbi:hypothetical protein RC083_02825 [Pseudoalteromonas haloplanktis]|uniref:Uncharacterized protein n=1 Tax=Pseudoalteromonas haloplanktis TaxID=228 RepID=A0ABU1B7Y5_PSEHA|nr:MULTISPECIES: hypothetical protein [Pseudoalteromonas]MDQ9090523.1 hypothetical protein [Pseudoalteromonas haloplanktis]TMN74308.1 hypothetical protein CWB85_01270 [Pseudoalteromonas sp. S1727]BDF94088.1 hypothetical protein KAN5_09260 [Pseudoalteromonas sp. KAN5]
MLIVTKTALCSVVIAMMMVVIAFVITGSTIVSAFGTAMVLSIPILLPFIALYFMDIKSRKKPIEPLFYWLVLGAFIVTVILHIGWNYMMLADIMQKGSLGPEQGYWLLINLFGGFKALVVGAAIGVFCQLIYSGCFDKRSK